MMYRQQSVTLDLDTDVTHQCYLHQTRDEHLIGIIEFNKPSFQLKWGDLEYFRRRTEEFSVMPFPECVNAMIVDIRISMYFWTMKSRFYRGVYLKKTVLFAWLFLKIVLNYAGLFEPTWLSTDVDSAISEIREFMDMFVH